MTRHSLNGWVPCHRECDEWGRFALARSYWLPQELLKNRRATTHWMFSELLAATYPSIQVNSSLIFARDGNIYTSGGITAGIDLALALVEEDLGREITLAVARTMVVFPHRPGGQSQFSAYLDVREVKN